jgi:TetR/AcrR family transcriptional regulator, transcriptional repressor of aconitase
VTPVRFRSYACDCGHFARYHNESTFSMPKISLQRELARHDQILDAAATCFAHAGFASTAMPDIASAAEVSVGSLYRYFPNKEDLFLAVVADRVAVYNDAVFSELARPGQSLRRLRSALGRLQRLLADQSPDVARLSLELWARAHDVDALRVWLEEARARRIEAFRKVIDEGKLSGTIRRDVRASDAAAALMALSDGLVVQRSCTPFHQPAGNPLAEAERLLDSWRSQSDGTTAE